MEEEKELTGDASTRPSSYPQSEEKNNKNKAEVCNYQFSFGGAPFVAQARLGTICYV